MSSHHIVKDKQEPALIIANGEACRSELLGQLLEWSPFIVVLDGAYERVSQLGLKIDVILGDFDRLHNVEELVQDQHPIEIIHTPDQNKTDLEKGIDFLAERGFPAVNVIWATGLRADHSISNMTNLVRYRNRIQVTLWDDYSKIFLLPFHFEKWYAAGTPLSLIPVGTVDGISTSGLKYNLNGEQLRMGYRNGSSNEAEQSGIVKISYESGDMLLMECQDQPWTG